jgi:2-oxoglutarate dehydrogenase E2 component (dihydrolipoamide succinyltransferase)
MATEVKIPALGESITSGILAQWHVKSGDFVQAGQALFDLETDKITSEGTAEVAGRIEIRINEGEEVEIGAVVAVIDESQQPVQPDTPDKPAGQDLQGQREEPAAVHPPSVQRLASESGIAPETVEGSGKAGRVTKGDMLKAIAGKAEETGRKAREPAASGTEGHADERQTRRRMTPLRRTIANRLVQAQQTTAMLTTFNEVDMSAVISIRKKYQDAFVKRHDVKLGFMSFFTKAVVQALQQVPEVNAMIDGDEVVTNHYCDIGIAVSTQKGLLVPVVRDCDKKSFARIEKDILGYASRAKEGKITIEELQGGVFTITNGGVFGSMLSTPILNTPQSAILGMHTIQQRPVAVNGEVVIRPMMYLALSYDHRLVDGREAVTFLVAVKEAIEDPARLLFEI